MLEKIENKIIKKITGSELEDVDVELTDEEKYGVKKRQFTNLGFGLAMIFGCILGLFVGWLSADFLYQYINISIGLLNPPLALAFLVFGIGSLIVIFSSKKYSQMINKYKDENKEICDEFNPLTGKSKYKADLAMEKFKSKIIRSIKYLIVEILGLWSLIYMVVCGLYTSTLSLNIVFMSIIGLIILVVLIIENIHSIRKNKSKRQQAIEKIKEDEEDELIC